MITVDSFQSNLYKLMTWKNYWAYWKHLQPAQSFHSWTFQHIGFFFFLFCKSAGNTCRHYNDNYGILLQQQIFNKSKEFFSRNPTNVLTTGTRVLVLLTHISFFSQIPNKWSECVTLHPIVSQLILSQNLFQNFPLSFQHLPCLTNKAAIISICCHG